MKRSHVQWGFAATSIFFAVLSASQFIQFQQRSAINEAVQNVPAKLSPEQFVESNNLTDTSVSSRLQFARATAILNNGDLEMAEKYLGAMANSKSDPALASAAQFNLANGYLREALSADKTSGRFRSLVELAKQRYRDLLSIEPEHWNARHNLELSLRLVPEQDAYEIDERGKPIKSVSVIFPGFEDRELP